ncbi:hypothetical protein H7F15_09425 [Pontibacter sp. Tf4]|uniref:hypothetical protein n=1 Tax=Pontibacter sp. Tf4 TaxID=2761620 RepID=UPI0016258412|nr:hypothetical protein [Pontibacter sp. Tf4]MBB6611255.1 hypothetical protein [Pontibacter sp. Tf4]
MKTFTLILISFLLTSSVSIAQVDTIYTNTSKIPCLVKEITPEVVKYSLPDEEVTNSLYRNVVQKVVLKSGRVEVFAESAAYRRVDKWQDYENVILTQTEKEINGLERVGDISITEKGNTMFSNLNNIETRAQKKLKVVAAMMGGNVVFIRHQDNQGSRYGGVLGASFAMGTPAESFLAGAVFTNAPADLEKFKKLTNNKTEFKATESASFTGNADEARVYPSKRELKVQSVQQENGAIIIHGTLEGASKYKSFRVTSFDENFFYIFYEDKGTAYNIKMKI